jgi:hypothetical protein
MDWPRLERRGPCRAGCRSDRPPHQLIVLEVEWDRLVGDPLDLLRGLLADLVTAVES